MSLKQIDHQISESISNEKQRQVSIINLILDNSFQSNADLNNDNSIDVLDVVLLINIILRIN